MKTKAIEFVLRTTLVLIVKLSQVKDYSDESYNDRKAIKD